MGIFKFFRRGDTRSGNAGTSPKAEPPERAASPERHSAGEPKLAELYNKLANQLIEMIPEKWEAVHYLGEVGKGKSSSSSVFYFRPSGRGEYIKSNQIPQVYPVPKSVYMKQWVQLNHILLEIYDCFAANEQALWEQISFSLDKTGKFHVDFLYDVMHDTDGGQLIRELMWAKNTFGYEPKEGSVQKKVLDNYRSQG